jgi:hypothetical protein
MDGDQADLDFATWAFRDMGAMAARHCHDRKVRSSHAPSQFATALPGPSQRTGNTP